MVNASLTCVVGVCVCVCVHMDPYLLGGEGRAIALLLG